MWGEGNNKNRQGVGSLEHADLVPGQTLQANGVIFSACHCQQVAAIWMPRQATSPWAGHIKLQYYHKSAISTTKHILARAWNISPQCAFWPFGFPQYWMGSDEGSPPGFSM